MTNLFQTTRFKILFVSILAKPILFFFQIFKLKTKVVCKRKGIWWELDLEEAIDFCLWLTHDYEPDLTKSFKNNISNRNIILDIGANAGIHTLYLASLAGKDGKVYAIEATKWGIEKIERNLNLNPELKDRVEIHHLFLTQNSSSQVPSNVSASWKISLNLRHPERNELDQGFSKSVDGAKIISLDEWVTQNNINHIDFIKLDVDGFEVEILKGASETIKQQQPKIYMELSPIHYEKKAIKFEEQVELITNAGYILKTTQDKYLSKNAIEIKRQIPRGVLINVLGVPE